MDNKRQEETDVVFILASLKKGLIATVNFFNWIISTTLKKWMVVFAYVVVFAGLGVGLGLLGKTYYTSYMSISHIRFENEYCGEMIGNLNAIISDGKGYDELAKTLQISVADAGMIKKFYYEPLNQHLAERYADSTTVLLPFRVGVDVYDNSVLDTLETAILNYFENNPFAQNKKSLDREALDKLEQKIVSEIAQNDSLKLKISDEVAPRSAAGGLVYGAPLDPSNIYRRGLELYEKQLQVNRKQKLNTSFYTMVGFTPHTKPSSPGTMYFIFWGGLIGYVIVLLRISRNKA